MELTIILMAGATMLLLAGVLGYVLGWANKVFHVEVDPRIEEVNKALPGVNCGGCGYVGCQPYAEAVVERNEAPDKCTVGGEAVAKQVATIMGVELKDTWPHRPIVHCRAHSEDKKGRSDYEGEPTCTAANLVSGVQGCTYGCLGMGDCEAACPFDAIHVVDGLATVDYEKCTGCGACARVCPRSIISMVPFKREQMPAVACSNKDFGKDVKAVCSVGCIGCTACSKASEIFRMEGKIARIDYEDYDPDNMESTWVAVKKCPAKGIVFVGKPSEEDKAKVVDEEVPELVEADFKTTVDKTEWHG